MNTYIIELWFLPRGQTPSDPSRDQNDGPDCIEHFQRPLAACCLCRVLLLFLCHVLAAQIFLPGTLTASVMHFVSQVIDPEKVGTSSCSSSLAHRLFSGDSSLNSYISYVVNTQVFGDNGETTSSATRRFSDFAWLQQQLAAAFKGFLIPPLPEKAIIGLGMHFHGPLTRQTQVASSLPSSLAAPVLW
jgi:hypothetical protein